MLGAGRKKGSVGLWLGNEGPLLWGKFTVWEARMRQACVCVCGGGVVGGGQVLLALGACCGCSTGSESPAAQP